MNKIISTQQGFTFIEVMISSMILLMMVAVTIQYHSSSGVHKDQDIYLKAVHKAHAELERLKSYYKNIGPVSNFVDFIENEPPEDLFLFKYDENNLIQYPAQLFHVYTQNDPMILRSLGTDNIPENYHKNYESIFENEGFDDPNNNSDGKVLVFYTDDGNTSANTFDTSLVVIDDFGSPYDPIDDLIGNIGWWVENIGLTCQRITFVLQFWYPGQPITIDPEIIDIQTIMCPNG